MGRFALAVAGASLILGALERLEIPHNAGALAGKIVGALN